MIPLTVNQLPQKFIFFSYARNTEYKNTKFPFKFKLKKLSFNTNEFIVKNNTKDKPIPISCNSHRLVTPFSNIYLKALRINTEREAEENGRKKIAFFDWTSFANAKGNGTVHRSFDVMKVPANFGPGLANTRPRERR